PPIYPDSNNQFDVGGNLSGTYKWGDGKIGLRGNGLFSKGGDRVGADVFAERVLETRYVVSGRASLWQWNDKLREDRDATSFGYVAGLGYKFAERSSASFEFDHNINRIVGHRFRVMLWLSLAVTK